MIKLTTPETDALECAFALLKCSPIGNPENSSEYGRAAYILSEHCQGKEDVSEAAMRIFAKRIADLEHERDEAIIKYTGEANELERQRNHAIAKCEDARRDLAEARDEAAMWKWHWMAARKEVENLIKEEAK